MNTTPSPTGKTTALVASFACACVRFRLFRFVLFSSKMTTAKAADMNGETSEKSENILVTLDETHQNITNKMPKKSFLWPGRAEKWSKKAIFGHFLVGENGIPCYKMGPKGDLCDPKMVPIFAYPTAAHPILARMVGGSHAITPSHAVTPLEGPLTL